MLKVLIEKPRKNEQMLIALLWKNPFFYKTVKAHKITSKTFVDKTSYVYFTIGMNMFDIGISSFDKLSVYTYIDKKKELKEELDLAGGYDYISELVDLLPSSDISNVEYHVSEILKFQSLRELYDAGLISKENKENLERLIGLSPDELRLYMNHKINKSLSNFNSSNYEIYDLIDEGLFDVIKNAKEGVQGAIPFFNAKRLTKITKGWQLGKLYYLITPSGLGKSTMSRNIFLPSIIENKQNTLIFVNEETKDMWQLNLLVTIANLKIKGKSVFKEKVLQGGFSEEDEQILIEAAKWLIENQNEFIIKIIALKSYRFDDIIKILEEYRPYNISTMILDTFKPTTGRSSSGTQRWEEFGENAQELYDMIKSENLNIRCIATAQMKIGYREKYLGLDSIGKSKEIAEVADVAMLCRELFIDEMPGGLNEIKTYKWDRKSKDSKWKKVEIELDPNKKYIIMFFGKNRFGPLTEQIIYEMDYERNLVHEAGFTELRQSSN